MKNPIVVGTDGTADGLRALEYAIATERQLKSGLVLVHAFRDTSPTPMLPYLPEEKGRALGQQVLDDAAQHVAEAELDVDVETRCESGSTARVLARAAKDARMVVLGRRDIGGFERLLTGSTTVGVAARARCPVVAVSSTWTPDQTTARVVVGIDGSERSTAALAYAFSEASARNAELVVLHAWRAPNPYYETVPELDDTTAAWRERAELVLAETVAGWSERYPDVSVTARFERSHPAHALIAASVDAQLLVVGTRGRGGVPGLALGSTARAVLAGSKCSVALVRHPKKAKHRAKAAAEAKPVSITDELFAPMY